MHMHPVMQIDNVDEPYIYPTHQTTIAASKQIYMVASYTVSENELSKTEVKIIMFFADYMQNS